jgi:hypothetical protein
MNMSTEVDEAYYSPASFTDKLGSSQEMETQAASMKYGMGGGSGGQKITLTRWLSAKVQDFPEVSNSYKYLTTWLWPCDAHLIIDCI